MQKAIGVPMRLQLPLRMLMILGLVVCSAAGQVSFYRGVNLRGPAVIIAGQQWLSQEQALASGMSIQNAVTSTSNCGTIAGSQFLPPVDGAMASMLSCAAWRGGTQPGSGFSIHYTVPNGTYEVMLYTIEDYRDYYRAIDVKVEGQVVARGIGQLPRYGWAQYGPYRTTVSDGVLTIEILNGGKGDPSLSGFAIYRVESSSTPTANQPPQVRLVAPSSGATFSAPASVLIRAEASDPDGSIAQVEIVGGNSLLAVLRNPPYEYTWQLNTAGTYAVFARAKDHAGAVSETPMVNFTVISAANPVIKVDSYGAVGDGRTDDTRAIQKAIDQSPEGAIIEFTLGRTYLVTASIRLASRRTYRGGGTIKMADWVPSGTDLLRLPYGSSTITVEGLRLDASGRGVILALGSGGGTTIPVEDVTVRGCELLNGASMHIAAPVGLRRAIIENNRFVNCVTCLYIVAAADLRIVGNQFEQAEGNAISLLAADRVFDYGSNVEIAYNRMRALKRMAIEVWGANSRYNEIKIHHNEVTAWRTGGNYYFGISVVSGNKHSITDNVLEGPEVGLGVEIGVPNAYLARNRIRGFSNGVVVQGTSDTLIEANEFSRQRDSAIVLSNVAPCPRVRIVNNQIKDALLYGVRTHVTDYAGLVIEGNTIVRAAGAWPDDQGLTYGGIKLDAGLQGTVLVRNNRILQTSTTVPSGFGFHGIRIFGYLAGSRIEGNRIESSTTQPNGTGFTLWFQPFLNGAWVVNNQFRNLTRVSNGYTSPSIQASGNTVCNVTYPDPNITTGSYCGP